MMAEAAELVVGQAYTRRQACALTGGGSHQCFLTHKHGNPLGIFYKEKWNPSATRGVFAISTGGPCFDPYVSVLLNKHLTIPVFKWVAANAWAYCGLWQAMGSLESGELFDEEVRKCIERQPGHPVAYVLVMRPGG